MAKAKTTTGLKVKVSILDKVYETGRKVVPGPFLNGIIFRLRSG